MTPVGPSRPARHTCPNTVIHWFGTIKQFPAIIQLFRVLSPGSPACVARGGIELLSLTTVITLACSRMRVLFLRRFVRTCLFGVPWCLIWGSAAEIRGLRISPLAVVLEPKFRIVHDLTFARTGGRASVNNDTFFS